jgi:hypothetical protein
MIVMGCRPKGTEKVQVKHGREVDASRSQMACFPFLAKWLVFHFFKTTVEFPSNPVFARLVDSSAVVVVFHRTDTHV